MYDPFKRARSKSISRVRRKTVSAFNSALKDMLSPTAPAKRKTSQAGKAATKPIKASRGVGKDDPRPAKASRAPALTVRKTAAVPRGASFKSGKYVCEFGERAFKIYIPATARTATKPLPLLVMIHGCGQTPDDFARGTGMNALAEEFGFLVLYPGQARDAHVNRCWNWYKRSDQVRGAGEPALIASLTRQTIAGHGADPARVYVAGLSAGASAALILADVYPDVFAAVGVHSGLSAGAAHDAASSVVAMRYGAPGLRRSGPMPTIIFHGDSDNVVSPRNGRFVAIRALEPYSNLRKTERNGHVPGGRSYVRTTHRLGKGRSFAEHWVISGGGHAWSGGNDAGRFTDSAGPNASREMVRFFLAHRISKRKRAGPRF